VVNRQCPTTQATGGGTHATSADEKSENRRVCGRKVDALMYVAFCVRPARTHLRGVEGLERVRFWRRLRSLHRAKLAAPSARVPQQHDGARAPVPALPYVRALGFLAHRVEVKLLQRGLQLLVRSTRRMWRYILGGGWQRKSHAEKRNYARVD